MSQEWLERLATNIRLLKAVRNTLLALAPLCAIGVLLARMANQESAMTALGIVGPLAGFVAALLSLRVSALSKGPRIARAKKAAAVIAAARAPGGVVIAAHYHYPAGAALAIDLRELFEGARWKVQGIGTRAGDPEGRTGITLQRTREGAASPEFEAMRAALHAAGVRFDLGTEPDSNIPQFHGSIYVGRPKGQMADD